MCTDGRTFRRLAKDVKSRGPTQAGAGGIKTIGRRGGRYEPASIPFDDDSH